MGTACSRKVQWHAGLPRDSKDGGILWSLASAGPTVTRAAVGAMTELPMYDEVKCFSFERNGRGYRPPFDSSSGRRIVFHFLHESI